MAGFCLKRAEALLTALVAVALVTGLVAGFSLSASSGTAGRGGPQNPASQPFYLTLLITGGNWFNGTVSDQPSYFVLQNNSTLSSSTITMPSDRRIVLTILNCDNGTDQLSMPIFNQAMGAANDTVGVASARGLTMNELQEPASLAGMAGWRNMTTLSSTDISHTFTIISGAVVVNVPVMPNSIEVSGFALPPGQYIWQCECSCGNGPGGWGGAMAPSEWMSGVVNTVS